MPLISLTPKARQTVNRILALILAVAITLAIYIFRHEIRQLRSLGYLGVFLINLISSASIFLPIPGAAFTAYGGSLYNPIWVALAAATGASIGELSGYMAGISGRGIFENAKTFSQVMIWMRKYGAWTILVMAFIPNPVFDAAGMAAGALKMPLWRFFIFCWVGKVLKMLMFSYTGFAFTDFLFRPPPPIP